MQLHRGYGTGLGQAAFGGGGAQDAGSPFSRRRSPEDCGVLKDFEVQVTFVDGEEVGLARGASSR